jgi:hypothetical protein
MITAMLLMTACSGEQTDDPVRRDGDGRVALQLTACMPAITMDATTRASSNVWEANDAIGVFALQHNTSVVTQDGNNVSYTLAEAGGSGYKDFNPTGVPLYLPIDGSQADICAYYPYQSNITNLTRVAIDMSDQTDQKAIDWMGTGRTQYTTQGGSTPISRQNPTCQLLFTHLMAKVQFNIVNGTGISAADLQENPSMQMIGLSTVGYLNLLTGAVNTNGGTTVAVAPQEMTTAETGFVKSYEATILPQTAGSCEVSLTIGNGPTSTYSFIMPARTFLPGKRYIYNVTVKKSSPSLADAFTINSTGTQVYFAPGNLQATWNGSDWTWAFAGHQWDYIGNAAGNTKVTDSSPFISENGTVDLFGWVGSSSTWTGVAQYGITSSTRLNNTNGYGESAYEGLKSDWGNTISDGYSWRTLTLDEWNYIFKTRTTSSTVFGTSRARYAHATINTDGISVNGIILFPDVVNIDESDVTSPGSVNVGSDWGTKCTSAQWAALADKGCVFLPAAGYRNGGWDGSAGSYGQYWSSSPGNVDTARSITFTSNSQNSFNSYSRSFGCSVRLVRPAE